MKLSAISKKSFCLNHFKAKSCCLTSIIAMNLISVAASSGNCMTVHLCTNQKMKKKNHVIVNFQTKTYIIHYEKKCFSFVSESLKLFAFFGLLETRGSRRRDISNMY